MAGSGQQIAEENFQKFVAWLLSKSDDDFRQMVNRDGTLSRKEIVAECRFGSSVINQNPRIKATLLSKEIELRERGILPPISDKNRYESSATSREVSAATQSFDADRLRRLEFENAALRAENKEIKRQLEKFAVLREVLSTTGRIPR